MASVIYVCEACSHGFQFQEMNSPPNKCDQCGEGNLRQTDEWEEFSCPECGYKLDSMTLQMHGNLKRIPEGLIRCKYDNTPMQLS